MKENQSELKPTDLKNIPINIVSDYKTRNANIEKGLILWERCEGTGNELFSMYRECKKCHGTGTYLRDIEGDDDCCTCRFEMVKCDKCKEKLEELGVNLDDLED